MKQGGKHKQKPRLGLLLAVGLFSVCLFAYPLYALTRPLPLVNAQATSLSLGTAQPESFNWPTGAQSAVGAIGFGVIGSSGNEHPAPTASIAKVVTAMAILKKRPIAKEQQGPTLTMTHEDVRVYEDTVAKDGSKVLVEVGEEITEYQALQAILLPSANNMAITASRWAFGSDEEYIKFANQYVASLGMYHTHIAGASGYEPETVSTPSDLVKLGEFVIQHPILAEIVAQKEATIPVAGTIKNVNMLLGESGYIGIKTGNSDQAGGCFLFAVKQDFEYGKSGVIVGAILGATDLYTAIQQSRTVIKDAVKQFSVMKVLTKDQTVAGYTTDWGATAKVVANEDAYQLVLRGKPIDFAVSLPAIASGSKQDLKIKASQGDYQQDIAVHFEKPLSKPSFIWRLTHPRN